MQHNFTVTVELVPPPGPDHGALLKTISSISHLHFSEFSIATKQVVKEMLAGAKEMVGGACVMPPFNRFEMLEQLL